MRIDTSNPDDIQQYKGNIRVMFTCNSHEPENEGGGGTRFPEMCGGTRDVTKACLALDTEEGWVRLHDFTPELDEAGGLTGKLKMHHDRTGTNVRLHHGVVTVAGLEDTEPTEEQVAQQAVADAVTMAEAAAVEEQVEPADDTPSVSMPQV